MADARKGRCRNVSFPNEEDHRESHFQTDKSKALVSYKVAESFDKINNTHSIHLCMSIQESDVQISEKRECTVYNIRRSPRLTSEKKEIPCLQNRFQCDENTSQCRAGSIGKNKAFAREAEVASMPGVQNRYVKNGACQADSALASLMKPSASVPSFEFYVRSEEGINLFVDLNSNPSDLFMRLENEVCISQNLQNYNFPSFRQELECLGNHNKQMKSSFLKNTNSEIGMNDHYLQTDSSPNPKNIENGHVGFYQPDEGDRSLGFSAAKPGSVAIEISLHSDKEKEVPILSTRLSSDISNKGISYTESCPRGGETTTIDSNVLGTPQVILACSSVVNLTSSGLESLNTSEDQNSKLDNENCGNVSLSNTCSLENPCAVHSGCSAIGTVEFQLLEVASRRNNSSSFPSDTVRNAERGDGGLANATEANPKICGNNTPACTEKWEKGNPVNGTEASDSLEKKDMVSGGTRKRKRHGKEIVDSGDQSKGRVLRSAKRLGGRDHPRRSMRLLK